MAAEFLRRHGIDLQYEMSKVQFGDAVNMDASVDSATQAIHTLEGVRLPKRDPNALWDVNISGGKISSVVCHNHSVEKPPTSPTTLYVKGQLLAPSLCHPHIHLDKCFLLFDPKFADLQVVKGDFSEALALTMKAKSRFQEDDLLRRGRWLIIESIAAGVTCMRAFVEVDSDVQFKCLHAALKLKEEFKTSCDIQLCVFAQEPVLSKRTNYPDGARLIEEALGYEGVDVLGSTPYVEESEFLMRANVDWAISTAMKHGKHLDLHLDYNLDPHNTPMVDHVIDSVKRQEWRQKAKDKTIVLSHCTRLTLFSAEKWQLLRNCIGDLPIFFIGLPTSDLYMMGKPEKNEGGGERPRGTLQIPDMIQKYSFNGAIGVNNVGNAFTPQGNCDPMSLASMAVGLYQAGTKEDTELLYVSRQKYLPAHCPFSILHKTYAQHCEQTRSAFQVELRPQSDFPLSWLWWTKAQMRILFSLVEMTGIENPSHEFLGAGILFRRSFAILQCAERQYTKVML